MRYSSLKQSIKNLLGDTNPQSKQQDFIPQFNASFELPVLNQILPYQIWDKYPNRFQQYTTTNNFELQCSLIC